ncbi:MAG TPA: hypothetical protein PKM88_09450 [bacterium]|nr:hypothetical protein [bacterium]
MAALYIVWLLVIALLLLRVDWLFGAAFLGLALFFLLLDRFFRCTRCPNYATPCYCGGGSIARKLFRRREMKADQADDMLGLLLGGLLLFFPLLVLLALDELHGWGARIGYSVVHLVLAGGWLALQQKQGCAKCRNTYCILYRE